jgi:hypothetical protein
VQKCISDKNKLKVYSVYIQYSIYSKYISSVGGCTNTFSLCTREVDVGEIDLCDLLSGGKGQIAPLMTLMSAVTTAVNI